MAFLDSNGAPLVAAYDSRLRRWHHFSPTLLQQYQDCNRIPYYAKILKLPQPPFKAQVLGTEFHGQAEHLVLTGQDTLGPRLRPIRQYLPAALPDPSVKAELGLDGRSKGERRFEEGYHYELAPRLAGVPVEGYADLVELRDFQPRISDYKTTSQIESVTDASGRVLKQGWAKTPEQLRTNLQLGIYAAEVMRRTGARFADVRHLYAQTTGAVSGKEVAVTLSLADAGETWLNAESLAQGLKSIEGAESDDGIEPTGKAKGLCSKYYGHECPFAKTCLRTPGAMLALAISGARVPRNVSSTSESTIIGDQTDMSLFKRVTSQTSTASPDGEPAAPQVPPSPAVAAPLPKPPEVPPQETISYPKTERGYDPPQEAFGIDAPDVRALLKGTTGQVQVTPNGSRLVFDTSGNLLGQLPPVIAKARIQDESTTPDAVLREQRKGVVPPDAPPNDPNYKPEEKKRGRPAKKAETPQPAAPASASSATQAPAPSAETSTTSATGARASVESLKGGGAVGKLPITLYVNAVPYDEPYTHLDEYAARCAAAVSAALQVPDFRMTDLGAIKGKGGLAAYVRENPPPAGTYVAILSSFDGPVNVAVEALLPLCHKKCRGVR